MKKLNKILLSFAMVFMLGVSLLLVGCDSGVTISISYSATSGGKVYGPHGAATTSKVAVFGNPDKEITLYAMPDEGYYFESWDGQRIFERTITVKFGEQSRGYQAWFYKGSQIYYNGCTITAKDGIIEDKDTYFSITPINPYSFGYWYEIPDNQFFPSNNSNQVFSDETIILYKNAITSNRYFAAANTAAGVAYLTFEDNISFMEELDSCTTFTEVLNTTNYVNNAFIKVTADEFTGSGYTYGSLINGEDGYKTRDINMQLKASYGYVALRLYRVGNKLTFKEDDYVINYGLGCWTEQYKIENGKYIYNITTTIS